MSRQIVRAVFAITMLLSPLWLYVAPTHADQAANNYTIGFQGRLLLKSGSSVPDGNYNMQFRIYKGGSGTAAGNPDGTLVWSENYLNSGTGSGISVKDGRFAVQLGSRQAFGDTIDWSQGNLRLSMNVAGSGSCATFGDTSCKADGEMLPMKQISASPYAMSAGTLGNKTADNFVQLGQGKQTDTSNGSSIFVDKTGNGNLIQLQHNGDDTFTVSNSGDIQLSGHGDRSITLQGTTTGSDLTISAGSSSADTTSGGDLVLSGGDAHGADANGGNIVLKGGAGSKNDVDGLVIIGTPTFQTTVNDDNCLPNGVLATNNCQISDKSINTSAAVIVGFSDDGKSATLPTPAIKTPGRILYIIGASDSKDFNMIYDSSGKVITLQSDTATSFMWNGTAWVPIGPQGSATPPTQPATTPTPTPTESPPAITTSGTTNNKASPADAVEGSMYYDDALDKIQCFQGGAWGDCTSAPDAFITISPEYSGAVMNGTDIGTISSDLCSDVLNINDGSPGQNNVCNKDETYNYYQWTSNETTAQTRSIYLTYKLPANFKEFIPDATSLTSKVSSDQAGVSYHLYRSRKSENLVACGDATKLTDLTGAWSELKVSGDADPSKCDFKAGDSMLIRIDLSAHASADAYVSNIDFVYSSQ